MRVLPKETHLFNVSNLGMLEGDLKKVQEQLRKPHGMVLVTGPTNSGKSTTLYAFLQQIGLERIDIVNISTVEDPIEYTMPRITQIQVDPGINLNFADGLRALLRQDPDILMVGEIRDSETADFAIQAALVGRLLLSSLHTNDAPATIPRLLDMGVEPYLIASTLSLVIAQRLARKLCEHCRESYVVDEATLNELRAHNDLDRAFNNLQREGIINSTDTSGLRFYKAVGCEHCNNTGFRGRIGLFELLPISQGIQEAINSRHDSDTIRRRALDEGMKTMFEDGLAKIILGHIDLAELFRVVYA
jgi:type II secretory ATPase GspE/PulE/Tfp pilus assembly ATPase PilB-like protein